MYWERYCGYGATKTHNHLLQNVCLGRALHYTALNSSISLILIFQSYDTSWSSTSCSCSLGSASPATNFHICYGAILTHDYLMIFTTVHCIDLKKPVWSNSSFLVFNQSINSISYYSLFMENGRVNFQG